MALKIRLARGGAKKRPFYRIVVAEASCPRDGRFVEKVGTYNPLLARDHAERIVLKNERIQHWLSVGALPTERVDLFLVEAGLRGKKERVSDPKKSAPKKRAQERLKAEEAAQAAANEKAAEAKAASVTQVAETTIRPDETPVAKDNPSSSVGARPEPQEMPNVQEPSINPPAPEELPVTDEPPAMPPIPEEKPIIQEPPMSPPAPEESPVTDEPPAIPSIPEEKPIVQEPPMSPPAPEEMP